MKPYIVRNGEHLQEIAFRLGFDAAEVWGNSKNAKLKEARGTGDLLSPGDILYVPDDPPKTFKISPGGTYEFNVDVPLVECSVVLADDQKPFASCKYEVRGGGVSVSGTTDDKGKATFSVPAYVREVLISLPEKWLQFRFVVGGMDHQNDRSGIRARLTNLGYYFGPQDGPFDEKEYERALRSFQRDNELPLTGQADEKTVEALLGGHGS